ncbi:MAG: hypothetical protein QUS13_07205 [Smithella sp.]|nr:hypothetical protein [Smithella sp.]
MHMFLSTLNSEILDRYYALMKQELKALVSYALLDTDTKEMVSRRVNKLLGLILDSGAWTDQKSPKPTDIDEFINYLLAAGRHYDFFFNLDQDFSEDVFSSLNLTNFLKMEEAGLTPVPVIHSLYTGEIEYYIDRQYPIVALGSSYATRLDALKFVFDRFSKVPETKIHIFGTASYENLIHVPAYSVDSSSWGTSGKFGELNYWNPESDKVDKTERVYIGGYYHPAEDVEHHFVTYPHRKQLEQYLYDTFKITYEDFFGANGYYNLQIVNIHFYVELERRINEEHRKRGFIK